MTILLVVNIGGVVDIRKCVEVLNKLPEMQRTVEENTKRIKAMEEILVRNKLVNARDYVREITTAKYE